jgi:hypothetical protein
MTILSSEKINEFQKVTEHEIMDNINDEHPEKQLQSRYFTEF